MIIGVLKEIKDNEFRVAAVPETVAEIVAHGHSVLVEKDAGLGSGYSDADYAAAGAEILDTAAEVYTRADLFYKVKEMFPQEWQYMNRDKSILAGKGGFLAALHHMQSVFGGNGTLLAKMPGLPTPVISIIGCGNSGVGAAELAAGFGNEVRILDINEAAMQKAAKILPENVTFLPSNRENLVKCLKESDVLINCIMWPKHRKDHLVYREDLRMMKPGAVLMDVACDDEGAVETCRSTSHDDPVYYEEGVLHYCVDNIPSAFARTASNMLGKATLPILLEMADKGVERALKENPHLRKGLTAYDGKLTLEETALKQNRPLTDVEELVKTF